MIPKSELLKLATKEFATTLTMMRAFPADQVAFRAHERSSDVRKLMSTFVFELYLTSGFIFGDPLDRAKFTGYKPATLADIIDDFRRETESALGRFEALPDAELEKQVVFNQTPFRADHFFLMMLCDQIHHRGQLSVYVGWLAARCRPCTGHRLTTRRRTCRSPA
jgi:uncharacterized damage-inducible protein DinB